MPSTWSQTASGRKFSIQALHENVYDVNDAIHAISKQCRFGGACIVEDIYSVAQHSVYVSLLLERWYPQDIQLQYDGLMHDITEGYLPDMIRPLKMLFPQYRAREHELALVLSRQFGFRYPYPPDVVKADLILCATEGAQIMAPSSEMWDLPYPADDQIIIQEMRPQQAKTFFIERYLKLRSSLPMG